MTETLRDMMTARANAAPVPRIDVDAAMRAGQRRVRRRRLVGGTAACAAVLAAILVVPAMWTAVDHVGIAGSGGFEARKVTYAEGSTIHYGRQRIDVPHEVRSFVQTDDGFVFADAKDTIYFTDGRDTAAIGHAGAFTHLHADDRGSYVAWVEVDPGRSPETVVYDTRSGTEVLRTSEGNGPGPGYLRDYDKPSIQAVDGQTVYVRNANGVVAVDISSGTSTVLIPPGSDFLLNDVANGRTARSDIESGLIVSTGPGSKEWRLPAYESGNLSPRGQLVFTAKVPPALRNNRVYVDRGENLSRVVDIATGQDVSPAWGDYADVWMSQWIDNDSFVAFGISGRDRPGDLLRCSILRGVCDVATASVGTPEQLRLPWGYDMQGS